MNTVQLSSFQVKEILDNAENQGAAIVSLYKLILPDWVNIEKVDGWPVCNKETWKEIYQLFRNYDDRVTNPKLRMQGKLEVMAGGLWFNNGFSCNAPEAESLKNFEILPCPVILKKPAEVVAC